MLRKIDVSQIGKIVDERKMIGSLAIPSSLHGYSMCVEYAKKFIYKKISKDFFRCTYIDGRYALDEFRRIPDVEYQISKENPVLAIVPNIDIAYNRDLVDITPNLVGIDNYIYRSRLETPFFEDHNKNLRIAVTLKAIQVAFTYKIRLNTRAEQLDLRDYMVIAFKAGATQGEYIDQDVILPYGMMINIAKDAGYDVKDNVVVDILSFMDYLNRNSKLPFTYKFRGVTGNNEFFIRMKEQYVHVRVNEIDKDDGDRKGHLDTNFTIEMNAVITYPVPQFYMYYSEISHFGIADKTGQIFSESFGVYELNMASMPDVNDHGWFIYMTTDIVEEDTSKPLYVDNLFELFYTLNSEESDIQRIIRWNNEMSINSQIFIDIKLFNNGKDIPCRIDWEKGVLSTDICLEHEASALAIYINREYMNEQLIEREKYYKTRAE